MGHASDSWISISFSTFTAQFTLNNIHFRQDYYTRGQTMPGLDNNQNYQLVYASEIGEYTELMFQRPRDTNDNDDVQFEVKSNLYVLEGLLSLVFET